MKTVIHAGLIVAIAVMVLLVYQSVQKPIRFNEEQRKRYAATEQRLKDIRTAQVAFKAENKRYTGSFDTLIAFLKEGHFKVVRLIGDEDDSADVKSGKIQRDTTLVKVLDSLFRKGYPVDSLRFVPFTGNTAQFELGTANLSAGKEGKVKVNVNVFEAKVHNDILLHGLDPQLLFNFNVYRETTVKYAGLKVGSLEETNNNAGNWE
ncbi:MAG: hypothetical protein LBU62_07665 [Bacteroidales bacterium]|jgi:hypothetical protein|nr:hypothetical protein [Bacteroidales bacterium]